MLDAGMTIPIDETVIPDISRIKGEHIANYALSLNPNDYNLRFSRILSSGLKPEDYPKHFDEIKSIILERIRGV